MPFCPYNSEDECYIYVNFIVFSKDKEIAGLLQKVEEDASEVASLQKKIRELEAKISELEEDLENERNARTRVCTVNLHLLVNGEEG